MNTFLTLSKTMLLGMITTPKPDDKNYILTVIEEEEVPLAPTISEPHLFPYMILGIGLLLVLFACIYYYIKCRKYQYRLVTLSENSDMLLVPSKKWSIWSLKKTIDVIEYHEAEKYL